MGEGQRGGRPPLFPWLALIVVGLAFSLRLYDLGDLGLWGDEGWTLYASSFSPADLAVVAGRDIHPPLYFYLVHFWGRVVGTGEFALRYLSVWAGTLVVAATFSLGKRLAGWRVGLTGALLVAVSPFAFYYSQEGRPFMWAVLWCVLAFYLLLRAVEAPTRGTWAAYALLTLLAGFTLYSTAVWFAAHGLLLLARRGWRRRFWTWLGVELGCLALVLPWVLVFGRATGVHLTGQGAFTGRDAMSAMALVGRSIEGLLAGATLPESVAWIVAGVVLLVGLGGVLVSWRRLWREAALAAGLALLPILLFYPIHLFFPWFEPRVLAFGVVPLCLYLAVGLEGWWLRRRWAFALMLALVLGALGVGLYDAATRFERYSPDLEDYRPLIDRVQAEAAAGDVVLYNAPWHVGYFQAYYRGPPLDFQPLLSTPFDQIADRPRQVWVVLRDIVRQPGGTRPEDRAEDRLSAGAFKVGEAWFGHIRLARYAVPPPGEAAFYPLEVELDNGVALRGFALQPALEGDLLVVRPGQAIYLTLRWEAGEAVTGNAAVFCQIVGPFNPATGSPVWAQHDGVPANQERPVAGWEAGEQVDDRHVMWLDAAAPAGDYVLWVGMYDPASGERVVVIGPDADHIVLAPVRVVEPD